MKKRTAILIFTCLMLGLLAACGAGNSKTTGDSDTKEEKTKQEAKSFLRTISTDDFKSKLADGKTEIIYVGRPSCVDCQEFQPLLKQVLQEEKITKLDYYNTDEASKKNRKAMIAMLKKMKVDSVPTLVALKAGKVESVFLGNDKKTDLKNWLSQQMN
ncbi:thioredoxin [Listeria floridensis FSL S10-1187]|uniref:Thioredoxin n=1 Tax=Listeria floridensis FSL S10-1187 TaxID=1265817 RepID=A0ABN0RGD8_9LIST|nr:thioredoxin family protein [Listeria floridensis]EUJ32953.1 thioredoxin [Listeria floridensis FSL S10-1187]